MFFFNRFCLKLHAKSAGAYEMLQDIVFLLRELCDKGETIMKAIKQAFKHKLLKESKMQFIIARSKVIDLPFLHLMKRQLKVTVAFCYCFNAVQHVFLLLA